MGSFPAGDSPQGLKDLAGNVWEWTSTADDSSDRVVRGGCWYSIWTGYLAAAYRWGRNPSARDSLEGFRCARTP